MEPLLPALDWLDCDCDCERPWLPPLLPFEERLALERLALERLADERVADDDFLGAARLALGREPPPFERLVGLPLERLPDVLRLPLEPLPDVLRLPLEERLDEVPPLEADERVDLVCGRDLVDAMSVPPSPSTSPFWLPAASAHASALNTPFTCTDSFPLGIEKRRKPDEVPRFPSQIRAVTGRRNQCNARTTISSPRRHGTQPPSGSCTAVTRAPSRATSCAVPFAPIWPRT
jgi:hypothetical protein